MGRAVELDGDMPQYIAVINRRRDQRTPRS